MKKFISFVLFIGLLLFQQNTASADSVDKVLRASSINKGAISVSVKDIATGKSLYSHNSTQPVNPASTQKLISSAVALDALGTDYTFKTELYKNTDNELYLKLSGDPFLSSKDLETLTDAAKNKNILEPKAFYIDDYVLDSEYWGEGWQWDDDLNPLMQKFGSYNLDNNIIKIVIKPTTLNAPAEVYPSEFYPIGIVNLVKTSNIDTSIKSSHNVNISNNLIELNGTVRNYTVQVLPVPNIKRYFRLRLEDAIKNSKILYYGKFQQKKLPSKNVYLVGKVEHGLDSALLGILQNSNNMMAETVFKIAGGKFVNNTGSINSSLALVNDFCQRNGLDPRDIRIVDGSGVSKNNLMTADFMTDFLIVMTKQKFFDIYKNSMSSPGVGTLTNRMLYFGDNLKAKTGTLSNISAIAGYMKTRQGKDVVFDIMINDPKSQSTDKKMLEELILRAIYVSY